MSLAHWAVWKMRKETIMHRIMDGSRGGKTKFPDALDYAYMVPCTEPEKPEKPKDAIRVRKMV